MKWRDGQRVLYRGEYGWVTGTNKHGQAGLTDCGRFVCVQFAGGRTIAIPVAEVETL